MKAICIFLLYLAEQAPMEINIPSRVFRRYREGIFGFTKTKSNANSRNSPRLRVQNPARRNVVTTKHLKRNISSSLTVEGSNMEPLRASQLILTQETLFDEASRNALNLVFEDSFRRYLENVDNREIWEEFTAHKGGTLNKVAKLIRVPSLGTMSMKSRSTGYTASVKGDG